MGTTFQYRLAGAGDTSALAELRIAFLAEISDAAGSDAEEQLRRALTSYFDRALADGSYICWLAFEGQALAATGGMAVWRKPGNFKNPDGAVGYIMNMYTLPAYRRRGICRALLERLADSARESGIRILELHATPDGEPLYRQLGYKEPASPYLELKLSE